MDVSLTDLVWPLGVLSVLIGAHWIWMIVDCVQNETSEGNTKVIWILVIVLAGWIGGLVYYFYRRPKRLRQQHEDVKEGFFQRGSSDS